MRQWQKVPTSETVQLFLRKVQKIQQKISKILLYPNFEKIKIKILKKSKIKNQKFWKKLKKYFWGSILINIRKKPRENERKTHKNDVNETNTFHLEQSNPKMEILKNWHLISSLVKEISVKFCAVSKFACSINVEDLLCQIFSIYESRQKVLSHIWALFARVLHPFFIPVLTILYTLFYGLLWSSMVFCGLLWSSVVLCGPLWSSMVLYGPLWSSVVLCGLLWSSMVLCGLLWSEFSVQRRNCA